MNQRSTADKKKAMETLCVERLREFLPNFPQGHIELFEEPDFLVHCTDRTLGIEVTELHRNTPVGATPQQALDAMRHRVVARAQELYIAKALPAVKVSVFMNDQFRINKRYVETLALAICNLVERNLPEQNSSREESYEWTNREYFPDCIYKVAVHRQQLITRTLFTCPGATWVSKLSTSDVARAATPKEQRYHTYRKNCDEVWLLISADSRPMSTWFDFDEIQLVEPLRTKFQRVFILRHFSKKIHELAVQD